MTDTALADRLGLLKLERLVEPPRSRSVAARPGRAAIGVSFAAGLSIGVGVLAAIALRPAESPSRSAEPAAGASAGASASGPVAAAGQLVASGFVVPRRGATVGAQITGTIRSILVVEGAQVRAGQIVAYLDNASALAALERTRAQVQMAAAEVRAVAAQRREASTMLDRKLQLAGRGFVTEASLESSRASAESLSAQVAQAQANLAAMEAVARSASIDVNRYVIRAPFAGVVVTKNAEVGEIVSPVSAGGGFTRTGILTLVDMTSLGVEVEVSEAHIGRVFVGQQVAVSIEAQPGETFQAAVSSIVPSADRTRATVKVRLDLIDRDRRILPQMAVRAAFATKELS